VLDAFAGAPITCGDLVMAPLSLASFMLLERIESPLVEGNGSIEVTAADTAAAIYVLTRPVDETLALLGQGREAFDCAVYALAARLTATELPAIGLKLRAVIQAAFATVVGGDAKKAETETAPSSPTKTTASAGG
jgi:hypothetical protein